MLHSFGQGNPSADTTWTTIKNVMKHKLVLTPTWAPGYNNSSTDL